MLVPVELDMAAVSPTAITVTAARPDNATGKCKAEQQQRGHCCFHNQTILERRRGYGV
jgi:hypothetical protein